MYSNIACSVPGVGNQQDLSNDLECDPFLDTALQRLTCDFYYRFGAFLAPVSVGIIIGKHYAKNSCLRLYEESENGNCDPAKQETVTKQKNLLRIEQGKKLVEYNRRKKEELKRLDEYIMKQDDMIELKAVELSNNYLYISGASVVVGWR